MMNLVFVKGSTTVGVISFMLVFAYTFYGAHNDILRSFIVSVRDILGSINVI